MKAPSFDATLQALLPSSEINDSSCAVFIPERPDMQGDFHHVVVSWEKETAATKGRLVLESILTKDNSFEPQNDAVLNWRFECSVSHGRIHPVSDWRASEESGSSELFEYKATSKAFKQRLKDISFVVVSPEHTLQVWQDPERAFPGRNKWQAKGPAPEEENALLGKANKKLADRKSEEEAKELAKKQMGFNF